MIRFDAHNQEVVKVDGYGFKVCSMRLEVQEIEQLVKDCIRFLKSIQEKTTLNELASRLSLEQAERIDKGIEKTGKTVTKRGTEKNNPRHPA